MSKQVQPDVLPDYVDVAHTLVAVTNSFTAVIRLVLLPGSDMIKVSIVVVEPLSDFTSRLSGPVLRRTVSS